MNKDLHYILHGKVPRAYSEMPKQMGNYERIAPGELCESYLKLVGGQKMFGSANKVSEKLTIAQKDKTFGPGSLPNIADKSQNDNQVTPLKVPKIAASIGGTTSAVTQKKQKEAHVLNMLEISNVSSHRPILK